MKTRATDFVVLQNHSQSDLVCIIGL